MQAQGLPEAAAGAGQHRGTLVSHHQASQYQVISNNSLPLGGGREQRESTGTQGRLEVEHGAPQIVKLKVNRKDIFSSHF